MTVGGTGSVVRQNLLWAKRGPRFWASTAVSTTRPGFAGLEPSWEASDNRLGSREREL